MSFNLMCFKSINGKKLLLTFILTFKLFYFVMFCLYVSFYVYAVRNLEFALIAKKLENCPSVMFMLKSGPDCVFAHVCLF